MIVDVIMIINIFTIINISNVIMIVNIIKIVDIAMIFNVIIFWDVVSGKITYSINFISESVVLFLVVPLLCKNLQIDDWANFSDKSYLFGCVDPSVGWVKIRNPIQDNPFLVAFLC